MKSLWRLRRFLHPYLSQMVLALLCLLALTATELAFPAVIRQVIDIGLGQGKVRLLLNSAMIILGLGLLHASLALGQRYLSEWVSHHVSYDLRNRLYNHIQHLPFSYHDRTMSGQLISRTIEDVRSIESFTRQGMFELARVALLLLGISIILFLSHPVLAAISLLPLLPMLVITGSFGQRISRFFLKVENALGDLSARLQENVSGAQVVRAFAQERSEIRRFDEINRRLFDARIDVIGEWSKIMPSTTFLVTLGTILILWFGGRMVIDGELTLGSLVAFNGYLLLLAEPVRMLGWLVNSAGEAAAGVQRTSEVLDIKPSIANPEEATILPKLSGEVEFRGVSFSYEGIPDRVLHEVNLKVEPNQIVALIGATGSGKSTLVNLVPRFYDVSHGAVLVDGLGLRTVDLPSLRRQIGIVLQSSLLFSTTITENIAYGRLDATEEEVQAAAMAAQAHTFIQELPDGYQTIVGERGVTLSGGQRQRVAIARALLMDPRILILDDSTSSVDTQTEFLIQQALAHLMEGRTTFVIAHRLSTIRRADLIVVMDHGRIVERGTHESLLAQEGLYRQIYDLQFRDQERYQAEIDALEGNDRKTLS